MQSCRQAAMHPCSHASMQPCVHAAMSDQASSCLLSKSLLSKSLFVFRCDHASLCKRLCPSVRPSVCLSATHSQRAAPCSRILCRVFGLVFSCSHSNAVSLFIGSALPLALKSIPTEIQFATIYERKKKETRTENETIRCGHCITDFRNISQNVEGRTDEHTNGRTY